MSRPIGKGLHLFINQNICRIDKGARGEKATWLSFKYKFDLMIKKKTFKENSSSEALLSVVFYGFVGCSVNHIKKVK